MVRSPLLQLLQLLGRQLRAFAGGIFLLDLLVDALGVERLVGILVEFRQLQLCRHFTDRCSRLVDQFLIESDSILGAVRLRIQRCQGVLATDAKSRLPTDATSLKLRSAVALSDRVCDVTPKK